MERGSLRMAVLVPASHNSLFSCQSVQTTERWQGKLRTCQRCVRNCESESIWTTLYRSLMKYILDVLNEQHVSRTELWRKKRKLSSKVISTRTKSKIHHSLEPRHGRSCSEVHWTLLRIVPQDDCPTKFPHRVWTVTTWDQKIWKLLQNFQRLGLRFNWHACIQQELEDQIYFEQFITWTDQSQSGTEHAVFDWHVSSAISITPPTRNIIVTLEIKQWIVNWN